MKKFPLFLMLVALLTAPVYFGCGDDDDDDDNDTTVMCSDYDTETACVADSACEWVDDAASKVLYPTQASATDDDDDDDDNDDAAGGSCQDISADDDDDDGGVALTGQTCTTDGDCGAGICLTTEVLINIGLEDFPPEAVIEDGYCSMLLCANDDQCGEDGKCLDITEFVGAQITACLLTCDETDVCEICRDSDEYRCYTREGFDDAACLPTDLIQALESDIGQGEDCDSTSW